MDMAQLGHCTGMRSSQIHAAFYLDACAILRIPANETMSNVMLCIDQAHAIATHLQEWLSLLVPLGVISLGFGLLQLVQRVDYVLKVRQRIL